MNYETREQTLPRSAIAAYSWTDNQSKNRADINFIFFKITFSMPDYWNKK